MRNVCTSSTAVVAILALMTTAPAASAQNWQASPQQRVELSRYLKRELAPALAQVPLNADANDRKTTRFKNPIKDIVIHTDWSVSVRGRVADPVNTLRVNVTQLHQLDDNSLIVSVSASAPISGQIWGEIRTVGRTRVNFSANANLSFTAQVRTSNDPDRPAIAEITSWNGAVDRVSINPDLFDILGNEARKQVNGVLGRENERIKGDANRALSAAIGQFLASNSG
jgi:hypothetical protein